MWVLSLTTDKTSDKMYEMLSYPKINYVKITHTKSEFLGHFMFYHTRQMVDKTAKLGSSRVCVYGNTYFLLWTYTILKNANSMANAKLKSAKPDNRDCTSGYWWLLLTKISNLNVRKLISMSSFFNGTFSILINVYAPNITKFISINNYTNVIPSLLNVYVLNYTM